MLTTQRNLRKRARVTQILVSLESSSFRASLFLLLLDMLDFYEKYGSTDLKEK